MKILVLGGSPNRKGSTQLLIDSFQQGAEEAGHTVTVLNVAHMNVHPCTGCIACGYDGPCVQMDDMREIRKKGHGIGYAGICHAAVLFRHLCAAQNGH